MNTEINHFANHLHPLVLSTNNFSDGVQFRKREDAIQRRYVALNEVFKSYICLDLDVPGSSYIYSDKNLPPPTITTISRDSGRCHFLYKLKAPVSYTEKSRRRPQRLFEVTDSALTRAFQADEGYAGRFTKNPLHPDWLVITNPVAYDLEDFQEWIDIQTRPALKIQNTKGRNSTLFDDLRLWAYTAHQHFNSFEQWQATVEDRATQLNADFPEPLPVKEALSVAKSVLNWVWRNRDRITGDAKNRGALQLADDMPLSEKLKASAAHAHQTNSAKDRNLRAMLQAVNKIRDLGKSPTQSEVSKITGLSLRTVRSNWPEIDSISEIYAKAP